MQDEVNVQAGKPPHWKCRAGTQGSVHTDRHSAGWMPAGPLEHRCWAEGAAGGQRKFDSGSLQALAAGTEHLVPELGVPLQLFVGWLRKTIVSFRREKRKAKSIAAHPPTGR